MHDMWLHVSVKYQVQSPNGVAAMGIKDEIVSTDPCFTISMGNFKNRWQN